MPATIPSAAIGGGDPASVEAWRAKSMKSVARFIAWERLFSPSGSLGRKVSAKGEELPATLEETIVGGIFWILYQRVIMGQAEQIESLLSELLEFSLTPYLGGEAAKWIAAEQQLTPTAG
jgi:hypothetical protein